MATTKQSTGDTPYDTEIEALKVDLKMLREDISALTSTVAGDIRTGAQVKASELTEEAKAKAARLQSEIEQQSDDLIKQIQANPFASIMIAVGLGFLVGLITRR